MSRVRRLEAGSVTVELALLTPALVVVLGLLVAGGRLWTARTTVAESADAAARAASLARDAGSAQVAGVDAGRAALTSAGLRCTAGAVQLQTAAFGVPVGTPATVRSRVTCTVSFADVLLPGMPGSMVLQAQGASALDTYRSRR